MERIWVNLVDIDSEKLGNLDGKGMKGKAKATAKFVSEESMVTLGRTICPIEGTGNY